MLGFGAGVALETLHKLVSGAPRTRRSWGVAGASALAANALCFALLYSHRSDGLNMRSTWLCSRNDIIGNLAVLVATAAVARLGVAWPDVLVGAGVALLLLRTAGLVIRADGSGRGSYRGIGSLSSARTMSGTPTAPGPSQ